jgi:methyl coenzyme M reductase alpha subunit
MKTLKFCAFAVSMALSTFSIQPALANGEIDGQVNELYKHIDKYTEEVSWLVSNYSGLVAEFEEGGKKSVNTEQLIEFWEEVDFHSAIETQYVPIYASIWQGIYGIKVGIEEGKSAAEVNQELATLEQAFYQALGAVRLAGHLQQKGVIEDVATTEVEPTTTVETLEDINTRLDRVVAKYAERLPEVATSLVHDTYLQRFEGVEGPIIALNADIVEDLEKDFNVTLPSAIKDGKSVDEIKAIVVAMQGKINNAKGLLEKAEETRRSVF